MSLRWSGLAFVVALGAVACGAPSKPVASAADEPKTAKEKQLREAKANGELDAPGAKWGDKWRYQGDRTDCIYLLGNQCFKTQKAACRAAKCKPGTKCTPSGGGPITVECKSR